MKAASRYSTLHYLLMANLVVGVAIVGIMLGKEKTMAQENNVPRIAPVTKDTWTPEQEELLKPFQREGGDIYNVYSTMANHPALFKDWLQFASYILRRSSLPPRDREMLILRIGWLCNAEYEWAQHVRIGKGAGLTDDDIQHIMDGPEAEDIPENDRSLLQAVDELRADAVISDETWNALSKTYSKEQMMDLVFTVGEYNLVSMALNSFGVQLDEGLEGFPK